MGDSARDQRVAGAAGARHETVVIGVGNPLMGDDGIGLAALARIGAWEFEPFVERVDGGTWGMNLLQFVEGTFVGGEDILMDLVQLLEEDSHDQDVDHLLEEDHKIIEKIEPPVRFILFISGLVIRKFS